MAVRPEETIVTRQGLSVLMDPGEVSEYLGVPTGTLANWRYQGRGPAFVRIGRHVRYRADDIGEWLATRASGAKSENGGVPAFRSVRR